LLIDAAVEFEYLGAGQNRQPSSKTGTRGCGRGIAGNAPAGTAVPKVQVWAADPADAVLWAGGLICDHALDGWDVMVLLPNPSNSSALQILGAKVDVPTLDGAKSVTIPPGSSSGQRLRLKGQGVATAGGKHQGDLFVVIKVVTPKKVDEESRKLIEDFQTRNPTNPRAGLW